MAPSRPAVQAEATCGPWSNFGNGRSAIGFSTTGLTGIGFGCAGARLRAGAASAGSAAIARTAASASAAGIAFDLFIGSPGSGNAARQPLLAAGRAAARLSLRVERNSGHDV